MRNFNSLVLFIILGSLAVVYGACSQATSCSACLVPSNDTCIWCSERATCIGVDGVCAGGMNSTVSNMTACSCTDSWRQKGCGNCLLNSECIWCEIGGCYSQSTNVKCHRLSSCTNSGLTSVDKAFMLAGALLIAVALLTVVGYLLFCRGESTETNQSRNECEEEEDLLAHLKHGTLRGHTSASIND